MRNKKNKFMTTLTVILFCLNVFCLGSVCAYADIVPSDTTVLTISDNNHDKTLNDTAGCCEMCDGHSCLNHYSFIYNSQVHLFSFQKTNKYLPLKELTLSSIFLKSIPKPPCSYSFI